MKTKRILAKSSYILVSVGIAFIIVFTALPYYCLTSIAFPGWNIYWGYNEVQRNMMILFPVLSFIGAVTTIKKKNYIEDIFLNVAFPLIILLILKVMQYHFFITIVAIIITGVFAISKAIDFMCSEQYPTGKFKRLRMIYFICRKRMIYLLLFTMEPMAVWVSYQESTDSGRILFEATVEEKSEVDEDEDISNLNLISSEQWQSLTVESRFEIVENFTNSECKKLGVGHVDVYGIKEITDGTLAYYSDSEEAVYYNIVYLNECSLKEALHVACHEIYHKYEHAVIDSLDVLEEAGIDYESLDYFSEAIEIKNASDNYYLDSLSYSTYSQNLLEVKAEEYANQEIKELEEMGILKEE